MVNPRFPIFNLTRQTQVPGQQPFTPTSVVSRISNTVSVTGSVTASITGSVTVSSIVATASVLVTNFPNPQTVSGTVTANPPLAGTTSLTTSQVSVTLSATQLFAVSSQTTFRQVSNSSTATTIYLGTSAVTTTSGYALGPSAFFVMENNSSPLYGIVAATTTSVFLMGWT